MGTPCVLFVDVFSYVLWLVQQIEAGEQPAHAHVRAEILGLLEQQRSLARQLGLLATDIREAEFAAVAWCDEVLSDATLWDHHERWKAFPLQEELYQIANAGEQFFERLARLRPAQRAVRESYYHCLALGFRGRYWHPDDALQLRDIRQAQARALHVEDLAQLDTFIPQPYTVPIPRSFPWERYKRRMLIGCAVLAGLLGGAVLCASLWPPPLSKALVEQELAKHPKIRQCANVTPYVIAATGTVILEGRVTGQEQSIRLQEIVRAMPQVASVKVALQVVPHPLCDIIEMLEPFQTPDLAMHLAPVYSVGERLQFQVTTPNFEENYLYVDYVTIQNDVQHIFPDVEDHMQNPIAAKTICTIGKARIWTIEPPTGQELVLGIASKIPLEELQAALAQKDAEAVASYVPKLRQVLSKVAPEDIAAAYMLIRTRAKTYASH